MRELYIVNTKKAYSWIKEREGKAQEKFLNVGFCDKIRLFFNLCPGKDLKKMYDKGTEMLDKEFDFM